MCAIDSEDDTQPDRPSATGANRWVLAVLVTHAGALTMFGIVLAIVAFGNAGRPARTPEPVVGPDAAHPSLETLSAWVVADE